MAGALSDMSAGMAALLTQLSTQLSAALTDRIVAVEQADELDVLVQPVQQTTRQVLPPGGARDALHGTWLGHPLHPLLVQLPIGCWVSAAALDLLPGGEPYARRLIGLGLLASGPTAAAGANDWSELHPPQLRVGLLHGAVNLAAAGAYALSLAARASGRTRLGRLLGFAGLGTVAVGGLLGGHLAYRQAAGANHAEAVVHLLPEGWQPLGPVADLPEGKPVRRLLAEVPLVVLRDSSEVRVLADWCSHLSGPLSEGSLQTIDGEACLQCPWHGSTFRLRDGAVIHGPATTPQPALRTRVRDGVLEVALPGAAGS